MLHEYYIREDKSITTKEEEGEELNMKSEKQSTGLIRLTHLTQKMDNILAKLDFEVYLPCSSNDVSAILVGHLETCFFKPF